MSCNIIKYVLKTLPIYSPIPPIRHIILLIILIMIFYYFNPWKKSDCDDVFLEWYWYIWNVSVREQAFIFGYEMSIINEGWHVHPIYNLPHFKVAEIDFVCL